MGSSKPPRLQHRKSETTSDPAVWPRMWEAWPLAFLTGVLVVGLAGSEDVPSPMLESAAIVDRTPPPVPDWPAPPQDIGDVLKDLGRGDCWTASARLRGIRKSQEDSPTLRTLEGALFVCAGDGKAAAAAVDPLVPNDSVGEATWIRANAALLMGSVDDAKRLLNILVEKDTKWRRSSQALLVRIDTL